MPHCLDADGLPERLVRQAQALADVLRDLAGHDLACWCRLAQPCHTDVLLQLASGALLPLANPDVKP